MGVTIRMDLYPTGRKHCSNCRRWRPLLDFGWRDKGRAPGILRSQCKTCERLRARALGGYNPAGPGAYGGRAPAEVCIHGHRMEGDNVVWRSDGTRRCKECWRAWEAGEERREYKRMWDDGRRRRRGAPRRNIQRSTPRGPKEQTALPIEPFARWLRELKEREGHKQAAVLTWMHPRSIDAYISGERATVHIDVVDAALMHEGSTFLWDLYPELYDFEDRAIAA